MEISVKKFEAIMDFAVTQMGCSPSSLALRPSVFYLNLEKRIIPRFSIHKILIAKGLTGSKATILTILQLKHEVFLKRYVIPYKVEAPEVWQIYNQASNRHVLKDSKNEEVTFCPESSTENVAAPPKVAKVVDKSQTGKPKNKALASDLMEQDEELEKEEEANKATKPKKILRKSKKKVEEMQGGGAKKDKGDHSNIEFDEEEKDMSNREEEIAVVHIVGKVSEGSQASGLKRKVSKKVTKPKKVLKKSKKKIEEVQGSAAKKEEKDASKEEEENTALPMVRKVLEDEELEKEEEANKATEPKKILEKSKKKVEEMQGGGAKKDKGGHSNIEFDEEEKDKSNREEEIAAVPIIGKVSEGSQASGLKRVLLSPWSGKY
ncbi:reticulocyte-binding protein 2 homolog a-like isoform X2 [Papaver somniferum]|nr:reticulocyte-binding protein 2 homolog a-like isoform X2 [Papaver somniferum]